MSEDYPPEVQTGRGPYRISWWSPNMLAGVEIWPERDDPDLHDPDDDKDELGKRQYFVIKFPRAGQASGRGVRFGFRRRCGWCGVVLRGWQRNLCQKCGRSARAAWAGPPVASASRWEEDPDRWPWPWSRIRGKWRAWGQILRYKDRVRDHES